MYTINEILKQIVICKKNMNPMLLTGYSNSIFKNGKVYVSEKYDGWRMIYRQGKFYTRRGNEIKLPNSFYVFKNEYEYDGELWLGYETTSSDISATTNFEDAKFMIFDVPNMQGSYVKRYKHLLTLDETDNIKIVKQKLCDKEQMEEFYEEVLERGGEGVVLRLPTDTYKYDTRNSNYQKKKPFDILDAVVVGYFNSSKVIIEGYVSSLIVNADINGKTKQFKVSFKSTSPPVLGSIVTIRYSQQTATGLPKFPVLVGINLSKPEIDTFLAKKKSKHIYTPLIVDLDHPDCEGVITATECSKNGPMKMMAGKHVYYDNEKGIKHKVTCDRAGKTTYCSCEAWKYQILPAVFRTCKHCIAVFDYQPVVPWEVKNNSKKKHEAKKKIIG